ncbi:thioredoxin reductase (NADPH) [Edaphobacter aggregans]|uniref:Thioredoxin reductase (NADPH) n=1 Tax=Edaphobacter aggregans TaxID=570835 RepID=A0A428MQ59_9BACT|nr:FAD-dependent oxidoreductase [Edaphobacter aggregans]RSL19009.1 thioredoxin reductase (NADPH) [Edaphobacter aggregans]
MQDNPTLNREHIDRIRSVAQLRSVRSGEVLYEPSCPDVHLFVVLDGTVSIGRTGEDEKILAIREAGQFTGEMSLISGNRPLLTARVTQDGAVLELTREKVLSLMAKDSEVGDILMGAFVARRLLAIQLGAGNVVLFGTKSSARTLALREFLTRNGHPFTYIDIDADSCASELMEKLAVRSGEIPVVYCNRRYVLRNPSIAELAACLDLNINIDKGVRDVLVIGAGPAGLAAAVYAASEGLKTLVIEKSAPGGQAGSSSKIENYLGFPTGLSGQELANRSIAQAQKFGAQLMVAQSVVHIDSSRQPYKVVLESGLKFNARSIVIATGAQYARLPVEEADAFTGRGIYYNATYMEAQLCDSEEVAVVGGGNSAGQAAVFLAQTSSKVHLLVRSRKLSESMSQYLIARIEAHPRIEIHYLTQIVAVTGTAHLESIEWKDDASGVVVATPIRHVFVMAGAAPRTEWLEDSFLLDKKGFVVTGPDLVEFENFQWPLSRSPLLLETSVPGIFAVGDTRAGSVKRVASAVGEGAMAVHLVHRFLAESTEWRNAA